MSDFKVIETQDEFDKRVADRLKRAEEKFREENQKNLADLKNEIKTLREENLQFKNSIEDYKEKVGKVDELNEQIKNYQLADQKRNIASEFNIPYKLANRITGKDEDAMREDAKILSEYFKKSEPIVPLKNVNEVGSDDTGLKALLDGLDLEGE